MYYISENPTTNGNHGNPKGQPFHGCVGLPADLLSAYIEAQGFVRPVIENGQVASLEVNQEALDAYLAEHPDVPAQPEPTTDEILDVLLGVNA